jgi:hypothetical protein
MNRYFTAIRPTASPQKNPSPGRGPRRHGAKARLTPSLNAAYALTNCKGTWRVLYRHGAAIRYFSCIGNNLTFRTACHPGGNRRYDQ